jgi:hypothetical protein
MTPARINAPQAAKALADLMSPEEYADIATLNLDWEGDGFTPVLSIHLVKWLPEIAPENLQIFWPIDMEDAFGGDEKMNRDTLAQINTDLREEMMHNIELRRAKEADGTWVRPGENKVYVDG